MAATASGPVGQVELGRRLRHARERHAISLRKFAKRVGLSPSAVSQIETGGSQPSVRTLCALAAELSLSLDDLLDHRPAAPLGPPETRVLRRSERATLQVDTGVRLQRLTAGPDPLLDFLEVTYPPGSRLNAHRRLTRRAGIEMGVILSGELDVTVGSDSYRLGPGDSISLAWDQPHQFANNGSESALCVWVILPDGLDPSALRRLGPSAGANWTETPDQGTAPRRRTGATL